MSLRKPPKQFIGIATGVMDVNGKEIHEGQVLTRGTPIALTGSPNPEAKMHGGTKKVIKCTYHDGSFKVLVGHGQRYMLSSLLVRMNGLTIKE